MTRRRPTGGLPAGALDQLAGRPLGIYVHVPFCETRCGYCDFNTYTAAELGNGREPDTLRRHLLREVRLAAEVLGAGRRDLPPVSTIFFGGGTPTLLPAEHLGLIIAEIAARFGLAPDVEITTEANPETGHAGLPHPAAGGGLHPALDRHAVGRAAGAGGARPAAPARAGPEQAVAEARAAGFEHVNLDLIYGAPYETDADWQTSLDAAIGAGPDHISAYALVVEEGTALARQVARGVVPAPDDDVLADRYVLADERLRAAGYDWYEVSNWARTTGARCRHNELYWTGRELVGSRSRRAQPCRRGAVVERQAPGALRGTGSTRGPARRPAARPSTRRPGRPSGSCSASGCARGWPWHELPAARAGRAAAADLVGPARPARGRRWPRRAHPARAG